MPAADRLLRTERRSTKSRNRLELRRLRTRGRAARDAHLRQRAGPLPHEDLRWAGFGAMGDDGRGLLLTREVDARAGLTPTCVVGLMAFSLVACREDCPRTRQRLPMGAPRHSALVRL